MKKFAFVCLLLVPFFSLTAQNTVGVLSYQSEKVAPGYNLIFPNNQPDVFLLNNCGQIINQWTDEPQYRPGNIAYLLPNGNLIKCKRNNTPVFDPIWAGGGGAIVEMRDWDNNTLWTFVQNDSLRRLHHDIAPMPNGNVLMISWEQKTEAQAIQAGRNPALLAQAKLWPDYILELNPQTNQIVWEWHAWDHLIQDFDPTKDNYGDVAAHPERIDINWDKNNGLPDWMHSNSIDYNPELDQILLSVANFNEVWIIDHSTTTEEAAGHTGGLAGRGGDLIYRWGNPLTYRAGEADDQQLFYPHDIHWIDDFISPSSPYYQSLAVFNNRVTENSSEVNIFNPSFDNNDWAYPMQAGEWLPEGFSLSANHPMAEQMYSSTVSSVQLLWNDNLLICAGRNGYTFELTPEGEVVWEYRTPFDGPNPVIQGDDSNLNNLTFRFKRYPSDYEAFDGKDLTPQGFIELNPDDSFCDFLVNTRSDYQIYDKSNRLQVFPNPATSVLQIQNNLKQPTQIYIYNALGQLMHQGLIIESTSLDLSDWPSGTYWLRQEDGQTSSFLIQK